MSTLSLFDHSKQQLRPLLELNDELRKLTELEDDINATTIVAIGDQSHGKSSVIEALSGVDLPRGEGIKTRLPLILCLRKLQDNTSLSAGAAVPVETSEEYATIKASFKTGTKVANGSNEKNWEIEKIISLSDVSQEVEALTDAVAGKEKNVKDVEIELTVYRKDQDELTLIDLPGLTRVATKGQDKDIEDVIRAMYGKYMKPKETVLLNVVSVLVDVSTSESLKLSRELDPEGERTVLCLTKLDQYQDKALAEKVRSPIELFGIKKDNLFCVVNRSQAENEEGLKHDQVRVKEQQFFEKHKDISIISGIGALSKKLVKIQQERIWSTIPENVKVIQSRLKELQENLSGMKKFPQTQSEAYGEFETRLTEMMTRFSGHRTGHVVNSEDTFDMDTFEVSICIPACSPVGRVVTSDAVKCMGSTWTLSAKMEETPADTTTSRSKFNFELCNSRSDIVITPVTLVKCYGCSQNSTFECTRTSNTKFEWDIALNNEKRMDLTFSVDVKHSREIKSYQVDPLLSEKFEDHKKQFSKEIADYKSNLFFFSVPFANELRKAISSRSGCERLPSAIPTHIGVDAIRKLLNGVFPSADEFAENFKYQCYSVFLPSDDGSLIEEHFPEINFPNLHAFITKSTEKFFEQIITPALQQDIQKLKDYELEIDTENHYYMATVQKVRNTLGLKTTGDTTSTDKVTFLGENRIEELSNEDQTLIDLMVHIFAYCKVMKKRFIDNVILCAKYHLCSQNFETKLKRFLRAEVSSLEASSRIEEEEDGMIEEEERTSLLQLMSPNKEQKDQRVACETRIRQMEKALKKVKSVKAFLNSFNKPTHTNRY